MKELILTEKPSAAEAISAVLGVKKREAGFFVSDSYIVSWCYGHLLELAPPNAYGESYSKWRYEDLPIIPENWKHVPSKKKSEQLNIVKGLMNRDDVGGIVNACDAGREGELIFRLVYDYAKCRKPFKRLWISSMEDEAIKSAFDNLIDGAEFDDLYAAASCRARADWLVGYNATRLFSILYGTTLNTGRVQSPALALLAKREVDIKGFVPQQFYTVELDGGSFRAASGRFDTLAQAEEAMQSCGTATVADVKNTEKSILPPKLYDLTALQREANRMLGFTAQQTLEYAQSLYEKKLVSYPRTDSRFLSDDMADSTAALVSAIAPTAVCNISQVINTDKVTDHHAILPTMQSIQADTAPLPSGEGAILGMIKTRLVCAVADKHRYTETEVTFKAGSTEFKAKGKTVIHEGWKSADRPTPGDNDEETQPLPDFSQGQGFRVSPSVKEGTTTPPKRYTEDTLLAGMETAGADDMPEDAGRRGLGTPATRAGIIERLVKTGLIERSKRNLVPTEKGMTLIAILPDALTSAKLTAEWEHKLCRIESGILDSTAFMDSIAQFIASIVQENKTPKPEFQSLFSGATPSTGPSLGDCPRCGLQVSEGKKGFFCAGNTCGFKIWRESKFWVNKKKALTAPIVAALLKDKRVRLTGLYSAKTGKKYDATVVLDDTGDGFVNFKLEFDRR